MTTASVDVIWHAASAAKAAEELAASPRVGLTSEEAAVRLQRYGPNSLERVGSRRTLKILLSQFTDFLILVLVGACVVSALLGEFVDAGARMLPLVKLYEKRILPMAAKSFDSSERRVHRNRFQWPLLAAFLLWILDLCLGDRRR